MRYKLSILSASWLIATGAYAQQGGNNIDFSGTETVEVESSRVAEPESKVYILNQNSNNNANDNQLVNQPTTVVEASPLVESRADQIRQIRKNAEIQTEEKIVEKLEASRLEDERRRAERLFGDRWGSVNQAEASASQGSATATAVQIVPKAPVETVVSVEDKEAEKEALKEEILAEVNRSKLQATETIADAKPEKRYYISAGLGSMEYPDASNVEADIATGISLGVESDRLLIEGTFAYSKSYIDENRWVHRYGIWTRMDQYDFQLAAKYALLQTIVRPMVGVVGSYTHRKYTDPDPYARKYWGNYGDGESDSFDAGFLIGADFAASDTFTIGADFRYMYNLTSSNSDEFLTRRYLYRSDEEPIENMEHYLFTINAKFYF